MADNLPCSTVREELVKEEECDELPVDQNSDVEEDNVSVTSEWSDYDIDDGESLDEEIENTSLSERLQQSRSRVRSTTKQRSKNGYTWYVKPLERRSNQIGGDQPEIIPGPCNAAANLQSPEEFWEILFSDDIINIIVEHTNNKIEEFSLKIIAEGRELSSHHYRTDRTEIRALIGILYYAGLWKSSSVDYHNLWSKENGIAFYRCIMSHTRFTHLLACLRFDNKETRNLEDKFAPVRQIWEIFMNNCKNNYEPSRHCTVDEQLLGFRGRCPFKMYVKSKPDVYKSKPDKYGLKIITLNDASTAYLIHGIPYLGKDMKPNDGESIPEYFLREVTAPIHGTNRNVTCDNWFTTIPLLERMLRSPFNMTMTGTIRKNKKEIPAEMKVAHKYPPNSRYLFSKDVALVAYTPKKNRMALLASTYCYSTTIINNKPEILLHYNATKGGTDTYERLCQSHTTTKRTSRWSMRIFFGMLDQAAVNARILVKCRNRHLQITSTHCLKNIYMHLVTPYLRVRYQNQSLRSSLKLGIENILGIDTPPVPANFENIVLPAPLRCQICPRSRDRKTKQACASCSRPICRPHQAILCVECAGAE